MDTYRRSPIRASLKAGAIAAFAIGLAACEAEAPEVATPEEQAVLDEREENFESIGDAFKAIRGQLEQESPDFAAIAASAEEINTLGQNIEGHFIDATAREEGYDTEALAAIWEQPEEFASATQKLLDESATLAEVAGGEGADMAAVGEQVKALGGACKNCHEQFRYDDDK